MLKQNRVIVPTGIHKNYPGKNIYRKDQKLRSAFSLVIGLIRVYTVAIPSAHYCKSRKENPQKLTQLSPRSHPRHLVGKKTAQKDAIKDTTSDSQVNSYFPYRWSPASLTINIYFYRLHIYI